MIPRDVGENPRQGEDLGYGLDCKRHIRIADSEYPPVCCNDGNPEILGIHTGQRRDVIRHFTSMIGLQTFVHFFQYTLNGFG